MRKVAIAIESAGGSAWKVADGPSENVTEVLANARAESVKRGGGDGFLLVISTSGLEKRYKVSPLAVKKGGAK